MRVGYHPFKDKRSDEQHFVHQVVVPVYIPEMTGYFEESFNIFRICLQSIVDSVHDRTFITIVDNGSCAEVNHFLMELKQSHAIHELIVTVNTGKINALLKGITGHNPVLVTITDSDVFFRPGWQTETQRLFNTFPKAGAIGLIPQFKTFESMSGNVVWDNFHSKKLQFLPVKDAAALKLFYKSLGWDSNYNHDYLKYGLAIEKDNNIAYLGSGHVVTTFRRDVFDEVKTFNAYKMGGGSELYLDGLPCKKDYWRLTTYENFAFHLGNTLDEDFDPDQFPKQDNVYIPVSRQNRKPMGALAYLLKIRLAGKIFSYAWSRKMFFKFKGLPVKMVKKY